MPLLTRTDAEAIAHLELNSPKNLNALSGDMLDALQAEIDALRDDQSVRAIILSGAGNAFCAGHDLKEMQLARQDPDGGTAAWLDLFTRCSTVMQTIQSLPQPVIAQVHGIATAAGCQLVASCDLAVAAETTRFGVNGVNIGLFCSTPMVALTRNVPRKQAFEMLTTGRFLLASEAREIGLINRTVPVEDLAKETRELALSIAAKLPSAVKIGKQAFYEQVQMTTAQAYEYAGAVMAENMVHAQTNEGINAFLEKRKPAWD